MKKVITKILILICICMISCDTSKIYVSDNNIIDIKDIRDDLSVFNPEYKDVYIFKIDEPCNYDLKYNRLKKPRMTKKDIEKILGYEIEIVEE